MTVSVFTNMQHFSTCIGLLIVIGYSHRIKFSRGIITQQNTTRIFPGNSRASFYLRPGYFGIFSFTNATFSHKIKDTPFPAFITGIPVLNSRVFYLRIFHDYYFNNGSMELILISHRRCTSFQVRHITIFIGNNKGSFKLTGIHGIDTKVSRKFHGATNSFWDVYERAVTKNSRV